ncbi:MAG TPA: Uma2 family endonuclease [Aggregatilineales bacterium]|nr:Uma2 family endonuclease [Aggregatilineales bacterium]
MMAQAEIALKDLQAQQEQHGQKISFQEYLKAYNSFEGAHTEWNAGEVDSYVMTNNLIHQRLLFFLATLVNLFLERNKLGEIVLAGLPMFLGDDKPARQPDLLIVLNTHRDRIKPTYLDGIADVVVEIVSPESDERDHGKKFIEYELAGIPEYWLIDPIRHEADVYSLAEDRHFHRKARSEQGKLVSTVLAGFALDPTILWMESLPDSDATTALIAQMG